jgi:lycopene beta-cyclase
MSTHTVQHTRAQPGHDYVLVGGGLQSGLIALAVLAARPDARVAMVERDHAIGGNHTWCFHAGDLPGGMEPVVEPLVVRRWPDYNVAFARLSRRVAVPYAAITSQRFREVVGSRLQQAPGSALYTGVSARRLGAREVELGDGRTLTGELVIDARGPEGAPPGPAGYQKFVGLELVLSRPHRLARPRVMDATVPQIGGFRFFYVLPLKPDRVLLEDTYFADDPQLDRAAVRARVLARAHELGLEVAGVDRQEAGVLPMPWSGDVPVVPTGDEPLRAGYRGGWFHPATGYSLPVAARLARFVAARPPDSVVGDDLARFARRHRHQARYCHVLNRLVFGLFPPEQRHHVFERFYRMPEATIRRFYALQLTATDRARILVGRPPRGMSLRAGALHMGRV